MSHSNIPPTIIVTPPDVPPPEGAATGPLALLQVFKHRNYRLFFSGQLFSLMGTWITTVAQGWLVYALTDSPLLLGLTSFAGLAPVFFLSSFGGMVCDRVDRRKMLLVTQGLSMLESAALAVLTLTGEIRVWHIIVLALFQGLVNAFDVPTRQALTVEMVGREDLRNAISLNSMMFNLARVVGPPVAGLLVALVGEGVCFALDAFSYGAVLVSLTLMQFTARPKRAIENPLRELKAGFVYVWRVRQIRVSLMLLAVCSVFGAAYMTLLPAFARDVLKQGSQGLGLLYGAIGVGALAGAYTLSHVRDRHLPRTPLIAAAGFGIALIGFAQSHWMPLSLLLLLPVSFSLMLLGGSTNTIIQTVSRDDMRGRAVSFYAMAFMGMLPWGSLLLGWAAERLGTGLAVTLGGAICTIGASIAWRDRRKTPWVLAQDT
jgi:MFS family permease